MDEATIERIYERVLEEIVEPLVGRDITYNHELERYGKQLIGPEFIGVCASDRMPAKKGYFISNVDKSHEPGTHWLACINHNGHRYIYDSFARASGGLISQQYIDSDLTDKEQLTTENNCGARCLAWLMVAQHCGIKNALQI